MIKKTTIGVPLNRVEGDLEIKVELTDGVVTDAWSSGVMFRGFESMIVGRGSLDGLVITPRVCGLCSVCHLKTAARALDMIGGAKLPDNATRVRNVVMMSEHVQSDMRHAFLMFATDFTNPAYKKLPLYEEAVRRYEQFKGETVVSAIRETKKLVEVIAVLGGQWPHTSFMVPGGVTSLPHATDVLQCRHLVSQYAKWYEDRVLGCSMARWNDVKSATDLDKWLDESDAHRQSDLGFYIRFSKQAGLDKYGKGHEKFVGYGALDLPSNTEVKSVGKGSKLVPGGFVSNGKSESFDQEKIREHVRYSWFEDYDGGRHPFDGETKPYATGHEGKKYSWTKAPRYDGQPAETGPFAEMIIAGVPLYKDLLAKGGASVFARQLARMTRGAYFLPAMSAWLKEIDCKEEFCSPIEKIEEGKGFGLTEAARGALGHWVKIKDGKIEHYQIITPTAWNSSPRDSKDVRGPWEQALIGAKVSDPENPIELGHVIRSFDSCMVCSVHALSRDGGKRSEKKFNLW